MDEQYKERVFRFFSVLTKEELLAILKELYKEGAADLATMLELSVSELYVPMEFEDSIKFVIATGDDEKDEEFNKRIIDKYGSLYGEVTNVKTKE